MHVRHNIADGIKGGEVNRVLGVDFSKDVDVRGVVKKKTVLEHDVVTDSHNSHTTVVDTENENIGSYIPDPN